MDLQLNGAVALVTGGSRGIGLALARAFADEGARVAICGRDQGRLDEVVEAFAARGQQAFGVAADLYDAADCRRAVDAAASHYGRLDVLVNNAAGQVDSTPGSIEAATDEELMARFMGKTMSAIRCARAALPHMRAAGGGRIVNIGGTAARTIFRPDDSVSSGSTLPQGLGNAPLAPFTKALSEEAAKDRIRVNLVHPHVTATDRHEDRVRYRARTRGVSEDVARAELDAMFPIGRTPGPQDIVPIVLLLASPIADAITGQSIVVDGGALRGVNP